MFSPYIYQSEALKTPLLTSENYSNTRHKRYKPVEFVVSKFQASRDNSIYINRFNYADYSIPRATCQLACHLYRPDVV